MYIIKENVEESMREYGNKIKKQCTYEEYWNILNNCFFEDDFIDEASQNIIKSLLSDKLFCESLAEETITDIDKEIYLRELLEQIYDLERLFCERENIRKRIIPSSSYILRKYYSKIERESVNEVLYIKDFYKKVRKHLIVQEIYKDKYEVLNKEIEKKIFYKRYGHKMTLEGSYYCASPITDLTISNVKRGSLLKRKPKDMSNKMEYAYDKDGRLLRCIWYINEETIHKCEFLLYTDNWVWNIGYDIGKKIEPEYTILRRYFDEKIQEYERVSRIGWYGDYYRGFLGEMHKEKYQYSDKNILEIGREETYVFPRVRRNEKDNWFEETMDSIERLKYEFSCNEEGYLTEIIRKRYLGERLWDSASWDIQKTKIKSTGKNASRWRKPDYFEEI